MSDDLSTGLSRRFESSLSRLGRVVFGDRTGLALFTGALVFYGLYWRLGFFVNDTTLFANALSNVADGRLALVEAPYSLTARSQPGAVVVDGRLYARNYGQVFLAVPLLWVLEALSWVSELRIAFAAGWGLCLVAFARQVAVVFDRDWIGGVGAIAALVVFLGTVSVGTQLPTRGGQAQLELYALQLSTMLVAAFLPVILYRLVKRFHGRRVGLATGAGLVLATPVSFWASIPKRHVLTAAAVGLTLLCFAVSREASTRELASRGLGYSALAFLALVHPFEAVFLLLVFAPLDMLTAPSRSVRSTVLLGGIFLLSLLPLFVVNTLISGNPLRPPRLLENVPKDFSVSETPGGGDSAQAADGGSTSGQTGDGSGGGTADGGSTSGQTEDGSTGGTSDGGSTSGQTEDGSTGGTSDGGSSTESADGGSPDDQSAGDGEQGTAGESSGDDTNGGLSLRSLVPAPLVRAAGFGGEIAGFIYGSLVEGAGAVRDFDRLYHTFIRSGWIPEFRYDLTDYEAIDLALLETFPLFAALCWLPVLAVRRFRATVPARLLPVTPAGQTDLLAAGYALVFSLVYLPLLPFHSQITVRYLLPIVPLLLYGVVRLAVVRDAVETQLRVLVASYTVAVVLGGVALLVVLAVADPAVGEAMQLHALLGLVTACVAAGAVLTWPLHDAERVVAAALAVPAAATTLFVLFSGTIYFQYGPFALDVVGEIVSLLP